MLLTVNCLSTSQISNSSPSKFIIDTSFLSITTESQSVSMPFSSLKSIHTKNEVSSFLLKVKCINKENGSMCINTEKEMGFVLEFDSMHLRDLMKNILLDRQSRYSNNSNNNSSNNTSNNNSNNNSSNNTSNNNSINTIRHMERKIEHITHENFYSALNQPLLDVFITMNSSIDQFFNQLTNSYFYSIKNKRNSFDRLLNEYLRNSLNINYSDNVCDYATRINTHSLLSISDNSSDNSGSFEGNAKASRPVEFNPDFSHIYDNECIDGNDGRVGDGNDNERIDGNDGRVGNDINQYTHHHTHPFNIEDVDINFDVNDFTLARELCKSAFNNTDVHEIERFSERFKSLIEGKYGKVALEWVERLIPTFYARKQK